MRFTKRDDAEVLTIFPSAVLVNELYILPYSPCKQRSKGEKPEAVIDTSYYIFSFTYTIITYILTSTITY